MLDHFLNAAYGRQQEQEATQKLASVMGGLPQTTLLALATGQEKLAYYDPCPVGSNSGGPPSWLDRFKGTPLFERAFALEQQDLQMQMQDQATDAAERPEREQRYSMRSAERDAIGVHRKMLELELAALEEGVPMDGGSEEPVEDAAVEAPKEAPPGPPPPPAEKEAAAARFRAGLVKQAAARFKAASVSIPQAMLGAGLIGGASGLAGGAGRAMGNALTQKLDPELAEELTQAEAQQGGPLSRTLNAHPMLGGALYSGGTLAAAAGGGMLGHQLGSKLGPRAGVAGGLIGAAAPLLAGPVADHLLAKREQAAKTAGLMGAAAGGLAGAAKAALPGVGQSLAQAGTRTLGAFQRGGVGAGLRTAGRSALSFAGQHPVAAAGAAGLGAGLLAGKATG